MEIKAAQAKRAHRNLAGFLLLFIAVQAHSTALGWGRMVYQFPLVEIALVLAFAAQVVLGFRLLASIAKRKRKGLWHRVQFFSACYLAYFIVAHTTAALVTRLGFGLDTNFYWASATLRIEPLKYGFAPYYTLAVIALFSHIIAALHFRRNRKWHAYALALGPVVGVIFVMGYGGVFDTVELPQEYQDFYANFPGVEG
jgi:hypothetical protein